MFSVMQAFSVWTGGQIETQCDSAIIGVKCTAIYQKNQAVDVHFLYWLKIQLSLTREKKLYFCCGLLTSVQLVSGITA